jgi:heme exporter protein A
MRLASADFRSVGIAAMNQTQRSPGPFAPPHVMAQGLSVSRGERVLFQDLSFEVKSGGVLLLRGPNGAGKSTLLMTLAGIVRLDAGVIEGVGREDVHLLNYQSGLKGRLTVRENLQFWRVMNGASGLSVAEALDWVGIGGLEGLEAGYLSSGQLRRLALARLLVSYRPIWLLDEPDASLDLEGERLLGSLVDAHRQAGGVAIVATHHDLNLKEINGIKTVMLGGRA